MCPRLSLPLFFHPLKTLFGPMCNRNKATNRVKSKFKMKYCLELNLATFELQLADLWDQ